MGALSLPLLLRDPVLWQDPYIPGWTATCMTFVIIYLAVTPAARDSLRTWLGGPQWGAGLA